MAFYDSFTWIDWILIALICVFLFIIVRNVYRLMKKRNEYISYKEAKEQYNREHQGHLQSEEAAVDAQFEKSENESERT